jgi:transposase-like protein
MTVPWNWGDKPERNKEVIRLFLNKNSQAQIARRFGLSDGRVWAIINQWKCDGRPSPDKETTSRLPLEYYVL